MTIPQRTTLHSMALAISTLCLFFVSLWIVTTWRLDPHTTTAHLTAHWSLFSFVNILWLGVLYIFDLFLLGTYRKKEWLNTFFTAVVTAITVAIIVFYVQPDLVVTPRRILLLHAILSFGSFFTLAFVLSYLQQKQKTFSILFIGDQDTEVARLKRIANQHALEIQIECCTTDDLPKTALEQFDALTFLYGTLENDTKNILQQERLPILPYTQLYENILRRVPVSHLNQWEHIMPTGVSTTIYAISKRLVDIAAGIVLGSLFIITAPIIIPAIKLTSPGPIFFTQRRVTLQGRAFTIYKYRTMHTGTRSDIWTTPGDKRITKLGHWLRISHLDELPQAWNLLNGDLSLIGPRPEQEVLIDGISAQIPFYLKRHQIRCGITGWAQLHVYAGTMEETKEKLEYDLYYVKHRSLALDLEIILRTIRNLLRFDLYV